MKKFINPIPRVDAPDLSSKYYVLFDFKECVSKEDAVNGINDVLKKNKGKIYAGWLKAGEKVGFIPKFLTQDEVDPKYLTVLGKIRTLSAKELASEIIFHCPGLGKDGYYVEDLKERIVKWLDSDAKDEED